MTLADNNVRAQFTTTPRVGVHKYTFPDVSEARLIIDLMHGIYNYDGKVLWSTLRVENDTLLTGYRITNGWSRANYTYFAISLSKPIKTYGYRDMKQLKYRGFWRKFDIYNNFPEIAGQGVVTYFNFDNTDRKPITVKVALSAVSTEGALKNLKAEAEGLTFEQARAKNEALWEKELACIDVEGSEDQKAMIYTSLYHTLINPSIYMDVDRKYRGVDGNIHEAKDFDNYTIFSVWDTYRAEHPFLQLVKPEHNLNMDALVKGAALNADEALRAMDETANCSYFPSVDKYKELGYAPYDKDKTAASNTLEYSYDDWTIYAAALKMGRKDIADKYAKRALFYRNTFDKKIGFASPRYANGEFKKDLDPYQTYDEGFIEGNSWNFSFQAPQDVNGLMKLYGGDKAFQKRIDELFQMHLPEKYYVDNEDITEEGLVGGYVHGNEPSHHIPYLYAWTSAPWKSQERLRTIMDQMYKNNIRGLSGNDDCGQMSAWYLFSAMGFYPVCPGSDQYVIGAPFLPYMQINLPNGKTVTIKAPGVSDQNRYIRNVRVNGRPYTKLYFTHDQLVNGATIEFDMTSKPNKSRGLKASDKPYSMTK